MYKLLIADDEAIERDALKYIIEKSDLPIQEIQEAANGQDAIAVAAVFQPDIIVMDIKMPGLDGIESSKIIRKIKEDTKIIFQTAFDEFDHAQAGIRLGVEAFIVKPASNERILEVLGNAIKDLNHESKEKENKAQIEDKLKQVSKYLEAEFLASVISGDLNEAQLNEYLEFMNINGHIGFGVAVMLNYNASTELSDLRKQMLKKRILEKLRQALKGARVTSFITYIKDMLYVLTLNDSIEDTYKDQDSIKSALVVFGESVQETFEVSIDLGIGDVKEGIQDMWQSFSMAKNDCRKWVFAREETPHQDLLPLLVRCLVECNDGLVNERVELLFEELAQANNDMDIFKVKLYEFIVLFNRAIYEEVPIQLESTEVIFGRIMGIKTVGSAKTVIKDYVQHIMVRIQEQKTDKTVVIMDKLITYINNHYAENITLEQLGKISGFSLFYLSKVFKKHVNMNFSDYLSYIRIKVAKRLLKNPTKSVKEISMEVGYSDPNYFARVFRKQEQMTPTEYRNRHLVI